MRHKKYDAAARVGTRRLVSLAAACMSIVSPTLPRVFMNSQAIATDRAVEPRTNSQKGCP